MKRKPFCLIASIVLIVGCTPESATPPNSASAEPTMVSTRTPNPTPTDTVLSFTPTPIPTTTATIYPEISETNPKQFVTELLQNNGGCNLPCLLGIPLDASSQPNVNTLMRYFRSMGVSLDNPSAGLGIEQQNRNDWSGALIQFRKDDVNVSVELYFYFDGVSLSQGVLRSRAYQNGSDFTRILYEDSYYSQLLQTFSIANILSLHGEPDQILIAPFPDDSEHQEANYAFSFVLFYRKQGFLIQYVSPRVKIGEYFVGCPQKSVIDISAWEPRIEMTLENAVQHFGSIDSINKLNWDYFKPIEEVSNYNTSSFYNIFKTRVDTCIETPQKMWTALEP